MANRFWVPSGGTSDGNWNTVNTANWSATSGGAVGASAPTAADNVIFDANSDSGVPFVVTVVATSPTILSIDASGLDQGMTLAGFVGCTVRGNVTLHATLFTWSSTANWAFQTNPAVLTSYGVTINSSILLNASTSNLTLGSDLVLASGKQITHSNGSFASAGYAMTLGLYVASTSNTRSINLGTSTVTLTGTGTVWGLAASTNLTLTAGSSTIILTGANTLFAGGTLSYGTVTQGAASTAMTLTGSNTIVTLGNSVQPTTIQLSVSATQTITNLALSGTAGNLVSLESTTPGSAATISKASGTVTVSYLSIKDSNPTGGAAWDASNGTNTDAGGNTPPGSGGWVFLPEEPPAAPYLGENMTAADPIYDHDAAVGHTDSQAEDLPPETPGIQPYLGEDITIVDPIYEPAASVGQTDYQFEDAPPEVPPIQPYLGEDITIADPAYLPVVAEGFFAWDAGVVEDIVPGRTTADENTPTPGYEQALFDPLFSEGATLAPSSDDYIFVWVLDVADSVVVDDGLTIAWSSLDTDVRAATAPDLIAEIEPGGLSADITTT